MDHVGVPKSEWQELIKEDYFCFRNAVRDHIELFKFLDIVESPIEALLLLEFINHWSLHPSIDANDRPCLSFGRRRESSNWQYAPLLLYVQLPISCLDQSLRLDFALLSETNNYTDSVRWAIEVDGHDFHEKTKEQAQRDKQRDRLLQASDIRVLHFTGSEVFRNTEKIVVEIEHTLRGFDNTNGKDATD